jgi:hypothetical protein
MPRISLYALVSLGLMLVSIFAPWATLLGIVSAGPASGGDAVVLAPAVIITAGLYWRYPAKLVTVFVSFITAALMSIEIVTIADGLGGNQYASPSWGIYLAGITVMMLYVVSIKLCFQRHSLKPVEVAEPVAVEV